MKPHTYRHYDVRAGRFISEDPIKLSGGDENLYRYIKNNSTNLKDPSGKIILAVPFLITAIIVTEEQIRILYAQTEHILELESLFDQNRQRIELLKNSCDSRDQRIVSTLYSMNDVIRSEIYQTRKDRNNSAFFGMLEAPFPTPVGIIHAIFDKWKWW